MTPISTTFSRYMTPRSIVSMTLRRLNCSRNSGAMNCSIFAAVVIIVIVPTNASSAFSSSRKPVQNVPPIMLAMTLDV